MIFEDNNKQNSTTTCCYKEPTWSGKCIDNEYGLDVLKSGLIVDNIKLTEKSHYIVGRFKTCDLVFEHPSLSRFHSVLQYCALDNDEGREKGWYIMDLDSTHGTILNKKIIPSHTFIRLHTGHVIKFGGSTRLYVVTGPQDDKEPLSKYTWTQLMEFKMSQSQRVADANGYLPEDDLKDSASCMWGMKEISENEINLDSKSENKYKHEDLYKDDPKKAIKNYFEREGFDENPPYEFSNRGFNKNVCSLELPVFGEHGEKIIAEVSGSDKRKELMVRCALEACRILDEMDELFKAGGTARRQKKDNKYYEDKDYYSSDEDDFLDRTGQIEQKRIQRMRRFGVALDTVEQPEKAVPKIDAKSSDSALVKFARLEEINDEILATEQQLEDARLAMEAGETATELDEIEKYLEAIQEGTLNKKMRLKLRSRIFELTKEENLLRKHLRLSIPVTKEMRESLYRCKQVSQVDSNTVKSPSVTMDTATLKSTTPGIKLPKIASTASQSKLAVPDHGDEIESESSADEEDEKIRVLDCVTSASDAPKDECAVVKDDDDDDISHSEHVPKRPRLAIEEATHECVEDDATDDCSSDWVPPTGQTGDGRTELNDALGY